MTSTLTRFAAASVLAAPFILSGCARDAYNIGQGWQRQECQKLPDQAERQRCLASNSRTFEEYQREAAKTRAGT